MASWHIPELTLFGCTQCAHCNRIVDQQTAVYKYYHIGRSTKSEVFCGEDCHHRWYIKRLNTMGM